METLLQDIRYAARQLLRSAGFAAVAIVTLGLGIGATVAIFSVVNGVLLRPLPYAEPDRLARIWNQWEGSPEADLSPAEYFDVREQAEVFSTIGVYSPAGLATFGDTDPERVESRWVSAGVFATLGVEPLLGRAFTAEEDAPAGSPAVILHHGLWQRRFGGDPDIVGNTVTLNGNAVTVVGVMPPGFRLPDDFGSGDATEVFVPLAIDRTTIPNRGSHFLAGVGRLKPGVSAEAASAEMSRIAAGFVRDFPDDYPAGMNFTASAVPLRDTIVGSVRPALLVLLGAVGLVLLIACANVANLLLVRAEYRQREMAIRTALGAGRARLVRQLMVESTVLALAGGGLGLLIAWGATEVLLGLRPPDLPRFGEVSLDLHVLGFAFGATLLTGLIFGLAPALYTASLKPQAALRESGRSATAGAGRQRFRHSLVVLQMAIALVLLLGAGLLVRSFLRLLSVDPGFRTESVLTVDISISTSEYPEVEQVVGFYDQLIERVQGLPGVQEAGAVTGLPLATTRGDLNFRIEGRPVPEGDVSPRADWQVVTPGYFRAIGMQLLRGRGIEPTDAADAPGVVVINETTVRRYWPNEDPIGQPIELGGGAGPEWPRVVGIVRDIRHEGLATEPNAEMYVPHAQFRVWDSGAPIRGLTLTLKTAAEPAALAGAVHREIRALDPGLPVREFTTMQQVRAESVARPRFLTALLAAFSVVALTLAAVAIYGVISYTVTRRTHEIGVRMALGARRRQVAGMVVRQGLILAAVGVGIGLLGGLAATRLLSGLLFGVSPTDPLTMVAVPLGLIAVALLAAYLPARRATRVDPMVALRAD
jgi:putative ABC transport system permease protein